MMWQFENGATRAAFGEATRDVYPLLTYLVVASRYDFSIKVFFGIGLSETLRPVKCATSQLIN